jgi:glycosyltransferase involved in cell wall biosynthesis
MKVRQLPAAPGAGSATNVAYSVVIPAYDAAGTIADAIASLLAQTIAAEAIIVVDDGSRDATGDVARGFGLPVTVIRQDNSGASVATNAGLAVVTTPLVAFLDADDLWVANKAERQIAALSDDPDLDGVFARLRLFRHGGSPDPDAAPRDNWGRTTLMIRTHRARDIGPLVDPPNGGGRGDTIDWIARARDMGQKLVMLPDVLAYRRIRPGSLSDGRDDRDVGYLMAVKRALDRRRGRGPT